MEAAAKPTTSPLEKVTAYCAIYRASLISLDAMGLRGILGAESHSLPDAVNQQVTALFEANVTWLKAAFPPEWPQSLKQSRAEQILATLHGAMILTTSMKNTQLFDHAAGLILSDITQD